MFKYQCLKKNSEKPCAKLAFLSKQLIINITNKTIISTSGRGTYDVLFCGWKVLNIQSTKDKQFFYRKY